MPNSNPAPSESTKPTLSTARMRECLSEFRAKNNALAVVLLLIDLGVFLSGLAVLMRWPNLLGCMVGGLIIWVGIVRLFLIGHDACHGALTSRPWLNKLLGRIAFVPSLTPYSLWRVGHNMVHHGFNNLRGRDFVWEPHTPEEYLALPAWRRALERLYRSALGPAAYYILEVWWKRMFFPNKRYMATRRMEFTADSLLVFCGAVVWISALIAAAYLSSASVTMLLLFGFVMPTVLWNWTVGIVVYLHHTSPHVAWYDDRRKWLADVAQVVATTHLTLPKPFGSLLHNIMEHPAHHLDASIPMYRLRAAQRYLQTVMQQVTATPLTLDYYLECVRNCKVYDYARRCWAPFPTAV